MKTNFVIFLIFATICFNTNAAIIHTSNDGNWANIGTWNGGVFPGETDNVQIDNNDSIWIVSTDSFIIIELWMGNGSIITIEGNLTIDSLHINNNAALFVSGILTINGGISMSNNSNLTVNQTGAMDIKGNINANNGTTLTVNGDLNVDGDLNMGNTGSIDVGDKGSIDIIGDFNSGGATIDGTGPITIGGTVSGTNSGDSQINGSLPIELMNFNVKYNDEFVDLTWATLSELNNDYFTIERSDNGISFSEIATLNGAGNSNVLINYRYIDSYNIQKICYYRLVQTDFNGTSVKFKATAVHAEDESIFNQIEIYPNPVSNNETLVIKAQGLLENELISVSIFDYKAKIVDSYQLMTDYNGSLRKIISTEKFRTGIFFVTIISRNATSTKKIIVK